MGISREFISSGTWDLIVDNVVRGLYHNSNHDLSKVEDVNMPSSKYLSLFDEERQFEFSVTGSHLPL